MFKCLPGFRDFYPTSCAKRNFIFSELRKVAKSFQFEEYDGPILEDSQLFLKKSGEEIVSQLFEFTDKGGRPVSLRPEMTPTLVRMVGYEVNALKKPIRWFNIGEHFRYERPQKGRLRSFYQANFDILGEESVFADIDLIALAIECFCQFGLTDRDFLVHISDREIWAYFFESIGFVQDQIGDLLGIIDKWERSKEHDLLAKCKDLLEKKKIAMAAEMLMQQIQAFKSIKTFSELQSFFKKDANQTLWEKLNERLGNWQRLLESLESMGYGKFITIDLGIVRGLAYYTGFVFEVFEREGKLRALAGGGRYDKLLKKLGYTELPACGFALGDVTLQEILSSKELWPNLAEVPNVVCIFDSEESQKLAMQDAVVFRRKNLSVTYAYHLKSPQQQLNEALKVGAQWVCFYKTVGLQKNEIELRHLSTQKEQKCLRENLDEVLELLLR